MKPESSLLKFQIGPVQEFIAQARSTRDLWSGSYLLSWLVAAGIRALPKDAKLIFPNREGQPLLETSLDPDAEGILTPNLPNIFIARIDGDAKTAIKAVKDAIEAEWRAIAAAVWAQRGHFDLPNSAEKRFRAQVNRHLSIAWQATPITNQTPEAYTDAYRRNGWHLDAVRQTRGFRAWDSAEGGTEKDSLSGREEALVGGGDHQKVVAALNAPGSADYSKLMGKHADHLGAVAIIKRLWHLAYLRQQIGNKPALKAGPGQHFIRSIPAIAARTAIHDDDENPQEKTLGEKYIAAIAFDGDSIGAWVNGDKSPADIDLEKHHGAFSAALSGFALGKVRTIVEGTPEERREVKWKGQLVYAGGDDVVCLVPAEIALDTAKELKTAFCGCTTHFEGNHGEKPDASAGIAIAHIRSPLQDLIREAQRAEKRAKNEVGRPAFSVTLMKRSGEISHWGSQWKSGGLDLYEAIRERMRSGALSEKFPHRVCELLSPYLVRATGLSKLEDAIADPAVGAELIAREFAHAAERQGSKAIAEELATPLKAYLDKLPTEFQTRLASVIGLCTTLAFAQRNA